MSDKHEETEQNYYKNLAANYRKSMCKIFDTYNDLKKYYNIGLIIMVVSLVINLILLVKCFDLNFKNTKLTKELAEMFNENVYLKGQNEDLWETYYAGVTGYDYYE